jgi:hypothetical protein
MLRLLFIALVACGGGEPPPLASKAPQPAPSRAVRVGNRTLTVYIPNDFPDPVLDRSTTPDPSVDKEFWTSTGPRGTLIVVVWRMPPSVPLDAATVTKLFDEWHAEIVETFHVESAWDRSRPRAREYRTRPRGDVPAMQYRYVVIGDRILDLRFIAKAPEQLDAPDIAAFFR